MKRFTLTIAAVLVISGAAFTLREDRDASRLKEIAVKFEKVLEFSGRPGDFYFKSPDNPYQRGINIDDEENIFILDNDLILKFSREGKFIKVILHFGQGPGEANQVEHYLIAADRVVIFNRQPSKIILKQTDGRLIREFHLEKELDKFFAYFDNHYYFFAGGEPEASGGKARIIDIAETLFIADRKGKVEVVNDCTIPIKTFYARKGGMSGMIHIGELLWVNFSDRYVFLSHTPEYGIKLLDLKKRRVVMTFKRDYKRQRPPEEVAEWLNRQAFGIKDKLYFRPPQKYLNDIQQLLVHNDSLWVITSTVSKEKGVLVDVYNQKGDYQGYFYLKLSPRLDYLDYYRFYAYTSKNHLYTIERDKYDNPYLVKYKIQ